MGALIHPKGQTVTVPAETEAYYLDKGWTRAGTKPDEPTPESVTPDKSWKNEDLVTYAAEHSIDLGGATKKDDLLAAIAAGKPVEPAPQIDDDGNPIEPGPELDADGNPVTSAAPTGADSE